MLVNTKWFGQIDISEEKVITFEKGLIGFENFKKYTIIYNSEKSDGKTIMWLQSLDEVSLALPIMNPELVKKDYDPVVDDELLKGIGVTGPTDLIVLVTLTVPADVTKMACNLKAPIVINAEKRLACQLIADNEEYPVRFPIYDILKADSKKGGE